MNPVFNEKGSSRLYFNTPSVTFAAGASIFNIQFPISFDNVTVDCIKITSLKHSMVVFGNVTNLLIPIANYNYNLSLQFTDNRQVIERKMSPAGLSAYSDMIIMGATSGESYENFNVSIKDTPVFNVHVDNIFSAVVPAGGYTGLLVFEINYDYGNFF